MRTILVLLAMALFLILSLPVYLILRIVGLFNKHTMTVLSQKMSVLFFKFVMIFSGTKRIIVGKENIPAGEAVLYAGNHRGLADIAVAYVTVPTQTGFVAKKEMKNVPVMSWWMKNMHCLFLDREDLKAGLKTILEGIDYMKQGYSMFIMPEGTRNKQEGLLPFKEGSLKMAEKTGCAIIPVAITNSDAVFERQYPWVKKATVVIHYGKPIYPNDLDKETKKHLGSHVRDIIAEMLKEDQSIKLSK